MKRYLAALACDPTGFGGVLISNTKIDVATATKK
jgi:phosphoribosylaminoimidazolecarboxamide formyltransferase/IMP cyclohydrolase